MRDNYKSTAPVFDAASPLKRAHTNFHTCAYQTPTIGCGIRALLHESRLSDPPAGLVPAPDMEEKKMREVLLKLGMVEELDAVVETDAQFTSRHIRNALQFTWMTMTAYVAWRAYAAWDTTHTVACAQNSALTALLSMLPIAGISVAIAHLNRHLHGR